MRGLENRRPRRLASVFHVLAMALLLAACGESATTTDERPGHENEPSIVYEMTLETSEEPPPPETTVETSPEPNPEETPQQASNGPENGSLASYGEVVTVERVVDGDTIEVSPAVDGVSEVRLIGVDTPRNLWRGRTVRGRGLHFHEGSPRRPASRPGIGCREDRPVWEASRLLVA